MSRRSYLPPSLAAREQRHRRAVLLGIGALLVLAMSPVVGHPLARGTDALFAGRDHVGALCLIALHFLLEPVHRLIHGLFAVGLAYAAWDRARAWRSLRRVLGTVHSEVPARGGAVHACALRAGVDPQSVRVVPGLPVPAFTAGWARPRIYVAGELERVLGPDELTAVLAHEGAHVRRRDPLRLSLLRATACTLFWLPALRCLADDFADEAEIRADDAAARDRPLALASALLALARWPRPDATPAAGVGFNERDLLERRVRRLAGVESPPRSHVTRGRVASAACALALVWITGTVTAHPLPGPGEGHGAHCEHGGLTALGHLFCSPAHARGERGVCPHAGV